MKICVSIYVNKPYYRIVRVGPILCQASRECSDLRTFHLAFLTSKSIIAIKGSRNLLSKTSGIIWMLIFTPPAKGSLVAGNVKTLSLSKTRRAAASQKWQDHPDGPNIPAHIRQLPTFVIRSWCQHNISVCPEIFHFPYFFKKSQFNFTPIETALRNNLDFIQHHHNGPALGIKVQFTINETMTIPSTCYSTIIYWSKMNFMYAARHQGYLLSYSQYLTAHQD